MNSSLTGFDDWLNRRLEESAHAAGEDVVTYVARAVAARMVADLRRVNSPGLEALLTHLSESGAFAGSAMLDTSPTISDPDRLHALYATGLLDSPPEERFDKLTRTAAAALDAPSAAISLIDTDRQFFKSAFGMDVDTPEKRQTPIDRSVCQYTVANHAPLIIEDARIHPIYKAHPAVLDGTMVAYLGIPLIDDQHHAIGTLCVFDTKPRVWGAGHIRILHDLADVAAERIFAESSRSGS